MDAQPQQKTIPMYAVLIAGVLLFCLIVGGGGFAIYYYNGSCGINRVDAAMTQLSDQFQRYEDAYNIANSTARISLAGPVAELQKLYRETEKIEVPSCMQKAKGELVAMMDSDVTAFLAFMGDASDATVTTFMAQSVEHLKQYNAELEAVNQCKPFCR